MSIRDLIPWKRDQGYAVGPEQSPLLSFQQEFNRLFDEFWNEWGMMTPDGGAGGMRAFQPRVNVQESDDAYAISAEIPGMDEKDLSIELQGNTLLLKGEKKMEEEKKEGGYIRRERRSGSFQRVITLPVEVEHEKATASYKKGILQITVPKAEKARTTRRQIEIQSE